MNFEQFLNAFCKLFEELVETNKKYKINSEELFSKNLWICALSFVYNDLCNDEKKFLIK